MLMILRILDSQHRSDGLLLQTMSTQKALEGYLRSLIVAFMQELRHLHDHTPTPFTNCCFKPL